MASPTSKEPEAVDGGRAKPGMMGWLSGKRQYRRKKKEIRDHEDEIEELNITAMLDMMTILLVFLLKSYAASATAITLSEDLTLPMSSSQQRVEEAIKVTVTQKSITVEDKVVVNLTNGAVDPSAKKDGDAGYFITPLFNKLREEVEKLEKIAKYNRGMAFQGKIIVIGDKKISYRLLTEVLYTAGQAKMGQFRLMVLRQAS